ncbi:MAG: hypothetical protein AUI50_01665 [Crenarchaeota archaeon 13_1_40CM_2_52_14]|nr:MAG: hypothetical protein AUI50_01665 [Crenarchaeota archaeon 13_1_40CM_2_52_14]OLE71098.1 MAG: hypothetical protein AUF78_03520 [archaeon 13_1_20CM_2_51_12]
MVKAVTLTKKQKTIVALASAGLVFFFLTPVVPVQGQTSIPIPADYYVARHCGWKAYNSTWLEFRSLGSHIFGLGYKFVAYNTPEPCCCV